MKKQKREKRKKRHKRYYRIPLQISDSKCPKGGTPLSIILFMKDDKLRSHAVKHMIKQHKDEIEGWKEVLQDLTMEDIKVCKENLEELGCPGFTDTMEYPPCMKTFQNSSIKVRCHLYAECAELVKRLVNEYVKITFEIIKEGLNIPRYACCQEKNGESLWVLPDKRLVAKAYLLNNNLYHLSTCFSPKSSSWQEIREHVKRRIGIESQNKPVWCKPEMWRSGLSMRDVFLKAIETREKDI